MDIGNDVIIKAAARVAIIGIDCPLGWPTAFTDFILAARNRSLPADAAATAAEKQRLAYRRTDVDVRRQVGRWPLSVSAERIAYPAMRCAGLLARLEVNGHLVRRSGVRSMVAGAVGLDRTVGPEDLAVADEEGWIHLPDAGFLEDGPSSPQPQLGNAGAVIGQGLTPGVR